MPAEPIEEFNATRAELNQKVRGLKSQTIDRLYSIDGVAYHASQKGGLDAKTKELMGLSVSLALRCDDCVKYHIGEAIAQGASRQELIETFEIATLVGGSIVIPHLRRAVAYMEAFEGYGG